MKRFDLHLRGTEALSDLAKSRVYNGIVGCKEAAMELSAGCLPLLPPPAHYTFTCFNVITTCRFFPCKVLLEPRCQRCYVVYVVHMYSAFLPQGVGVSVRLQRKHRNIVVEHYLKEDMCG